ncbi:hypothetical protein D7B24_009259 [Verticillium nonalfalfae]|uniref:Major facilitator superfamily (MFS) profile domain-containing protein n=1 Tax=Verticillium nonalfalfae TaxID=1051616 RepID=A0A3M9YI23_9PEZI|nr:uncharacterized protein D7B24_009259 [Verticillium nonalfalfae]RNJ60227.1 hypothetical protein D7B24_009259 [Verticillium nonalfalfae]
MVFLTGKALQTQITIAAGSGFLLFGFDQGVMSGMLTGDAFTRTFPEIDTSDNANGSANLQGLVVSIYEIGCLFGALICLFWGEQLGRRWSIMIGCVVLSVGAVLQASAYGIPQMIIGRIVAGLGNGMNTSTIPVWHSELMKPKSRGKGLAIELAINIFGVALSYWTNYGMSFVANDAQFRFPLALQILFAIMTFLTIAFVVPESPRWLIAHDRHDEARKILWAVETDAKTLDPNGSRINQYMREIQDAVREEREASQAGSYKMLLHDGPQRLRYRTLLGIGGQFMQQISGINLITYYAPVIMQKSVGLERNLSLLLAGFNGIAYFLTSLIPIWIIDRVGRRNLMLFAAAGQCACMAILSGTVADGGKSAGIVAVVMLFLFNGFFSVGLLAIPWLLPAEYAPLTIRTRAAALATASNWLFTFVVVKVTPVSIQDVGHHTYTYFSVFNFAFLPLIWFFYPETKNLTLEQIDRLFTGDKVLMHWQSSMGVPGEVEVSDHDKDYEAGAPEQVMHVQGDEKTVEKGA